MRNVCYACGVVLLVSVLGLLSCTTVENPVVAVIQQEGLKSIVDSWVEETYFSEASTGLDAYPNVGAVVVDGRMRGGGMLVDQDSVLTAAHLIMALDSEYVFMLQNRPIPVCKVDVHPDKSVDLAMLTLQWPVDVKDFPQVGEVVPNKLDPVTVVGYSFGYKKWSKPSKYLYYGVLTTETDSIKLSFIGMPFWFGDSGGPILYFKDGQTHIIGVVSSFLAHKERVLECSAASVKASIKWISDSMASQ